MKITLTVVGAGNTLLYSAEALVGEGAIQSNVARRVGRWWLKLLGEFA